MSLIRRIVVLLHAKTYLYVGGGNEGQDTS
jgi:hypothetical protein